MLKRFIPSREFFQRDLHNIIYIYIYIPINLKASCFMFMNVIILVVLDPAGTRKFEIDRVRLFIYFSLFDRV
jgi:hypothetical protein